MRNNSPFQNTSWIVFLCIITIIIQSATYYFIESNYITLGITALTSIICVHVFLEKTISYDLCFIYSFLMVFISTIITVSIYVGRDYSFIPFSKTMIYLVIINWFIPCLYCFIRNMFDSGPRYEGYRKFYLYSNILFIVPYLVVFSFVSFICMKYQDTFFSREVIPYIPFMGIASYIEDYIYHRMALKEIIEYLVIRIIFFIPFGYFIKLLFRRKGALLKILALILFPILVEAIQFFIYSDYMFIDDVIYAFVGGLLGMLLFSIQNFIYRLINGNHFLSSDRGSYYSRRTIYYH